MNQLISVIIPAYNAQDTIERCVKSIVGENIEIIIVIDGATDNTLKICQEIKKYNENVYIIEQSNKGQFEARRTGIKNANGKYTMFLDADDCFFENTILIMQEMINKYNEPDLIRFRYKKEPDGYAQYKYIEEEEKYILKKDFKKEVYPMFLNGYMLNAVWTNCVKTDLIKKIEIKKSNIKYGEDLLLNLEIFSNIKNVVLTNEILYKYIFSENSITTTCDLKKLLKNLEDSIEVYSVLYDYLVQWDMCDIENIDIVNNRVKKESNRIIQIIKEKII